MNRTKLGKALKYYLDNLGYRICQVAPDSVTGYTPPREITESECENVAQHMLETWDKHTD